ncbi:protein STAY-GREEN homolog, chloroplastic-like [Andrographis paniculata]|uniref:protein STAY-GREEN homolog, chloroplastic-like n=1 Tax=Andrographis paniculata TaxID=175694 RepID=UPI0021E76A01|nr:protein STAY-GREEN homolog, chloroplastic-like [Andrographis paniculata]
MAAAASSVVPWKLKPTSFREGKGNIQTIRKNIPTTTVIVVPVARLFGAATFEESKLSVMYLGLDEKRNPGKIRILPRIYTLTHSDLTAKLTLAISHTINNSQLQGWYNRFQRDEVVAEWKKIKGKMSLHVHCHISGGHSLLDIFANIRYYIFSKELPVVLKAFIHGDGSLFNNYPNLQESLVWVYFHSNIPEFNKVECWGPLKEANGPINMAMDAMDGSF